MRKNWTIVRSASELFRKFENDFFSAHSLPIFKRDLSEPFFFIREIIFVHEFRRFFCYVVISALKLCTLCIAHAQEFPKTVKIYAHDDVRPNFAMTKSEIWPKI